MSQPPSIFRAEAEAHRNAAERGEPLRIAPGWTNRTYWILAFFFCLALVFSLAARMNEYARGPAIVRFAGSRAVLAEGAGTVTEVVATPGQRVSKGDVIVRLDDSNERAKLAQIDKEIEVRTRQMLGSPNDEAAKERLAALRADLELVQAAVDRRSLRSPVDGIVADVRARPGQYVEASNLVASVVAKDSRARVIALLPGEYRPLLEIGQPLRLELDGFPYRYETLTVNSVAEGLVGPAEAKRILGEDIADAVKLDGPVMVVEAELDGTMFTADGSEYTYHDGMVGKAAATVRSRPVAIELIPGLKALVPDASG